MAGGFRGSRAGMKAREEFFGSDGVFAGVERGAAQRFHADEDRRAGCENFQGVPDGIFGVVILVAAEVPVVAWTRVEICLPVLTRVASMRRTILRPPSP